MAELSHEQLWHVCQRKPGDYEPYGQRKRLTATRPAEIACDCPGAPSDSSRLHWRVWQGVPRSGGNDADRTASQVVRRNQETQIDAGDASGECHSLQSV
jgi:hypothetical protein